VVALVSDKQITQYHHMYFKNNFHFIFIGFCFVIFAACNECVPNKKSVGHKRENVEEVKPINDSELLRKFTSDASDYYSDRGNTEAEDLYTQLANKSTSIESMGGVSSDVLEGSQFYDTYKKQVLIFGQMYKCCHCPDFHISPCSAFPISKDGLCVTNYHVFESFNPEEPTMYETAFVMDWKGKVYPVIEVLAANEQDDLAIFRVKCKENDLIPLAMGNDKNAGEPIHVISHPDQRFYRYTQGHINRTFIEPRISTTRQSISAEFARGSSGAPVLDNCGNVIGVIAGTMNINGGHKRDLYQLTIREMIPVSRLHELIQWTDIFSMIL